MPEAVLVTGGNRGIGRAIAMEFVNRGKAVFITSRKPVSVDGCTVLVADLTFPSACDSVIDQIESAGYTLSNVVVNAGVSAESLLVRTTDEQIDELVQVNLISTIRLARRAAKSMMKSRSGSIVFVGSVLGLSGSAGSSVYAATKSGLVGLTRSLAREIGSRNVTVNLVAPGYVNTDMTSNLSVEFKSKVIEQTPLARIAEPEEIAKTVAFLCSQDARFITGAIIPVDGGLGMGH
ncbi:MAG: SDR family oxidoreductase [Actinobacteria bacterium]|nr:SDR family oxidoreductase [Actinomycetota bacterium]